MPHTSDAQASRIILRTTPLVQIVDSY